MQRDDEKNRLYENYLSTGQAGVSMDNVEQIYQMRRPHFRKLIRAHIPESRECRICEIGCGGGAFIRCLREFGYKNIVGVEISPEMVDLAKAQGLDCVVQGDMNEYLRTCEPGSFDMIVMMDVLEHLSLGAQLDVLKSIGRLLSRPGRLLLHVPNGAGLFGMAIRYGDLTHETAFTPASMSVMLKASGFANVICLEDSPSIHGVKSLARSIIWTVASGIARVVHAAETGRWPKVLTQNMTVVASLSA